MADSPRAAASTEAARRPSRSAKVKAEATAPASSAAVASTSGRPQFSAGVSALQPLPKAPSTTAELPFVQPSSYLCLPKRTGGTMAEKQLSPLDKEQLMGLVSVACEVLSEDASATRHRCDSPEAGYRDGGAQRRRGLTKGHISEEFESSSRSGRVTMCCQCHLGLLFSIRTSLSRRASTSSSRTVPPTPYGGCARLPTPDS